MAPHILRRFSIATFVIFAMFVLFTFRQHGISNDEEVQHVYGRYLLNFYQSSFVDQSAFSYKNLYLYGGFFDLIAASIERFLGFDPESIIVWDMRHLISAIFGFLGLVATYKLAKMLAGERAALFAILLLAITGSWAGTMFTHTKDVPFACCMTWALYYTARIAQTAPKITLADSIKLGIAVGCALGLRVGGAFAVIYLLLSLTMIGWLINQSIKDKANFFLVSAVKLLPAGLVSLVLMGFFWPWAVMAPDHILEAASAFSHFSFNMLTMLNGTVYSIGDVPRYYLGAYLLVRLPEITLLGFITLIVIAIIQRQKWLIKLSALDKTSKAWIAVVIAILFPATFVAIDRPALYDGVRHFTFLIPIITLLAGCGLSLAIDALKPERKFLVAIPTLVLMVLTLGKLIALHPYEYIYFNKLAGSIEHAETHWQSDYWASSHKKAAELLTQYVDKIPASADAKPYTVASCSENIQGYAYLDHRFEVTKNWTKADFFISTTNMNCDQVLKGKEIGTVERLGFKIAVVKDRRDLQGDERLPHPAPKPLD